MSSPSRRPCPVCRQPLQGSVVYCTSCLAPHHRPCWEYAGGCSVYACGQVRFSLVPDRAEGVLEIGSSAPSLPVSGPSLPTPEVRSGKPSAPLKRLICFDRLPASRVFLDVLARGALIGFAARVFVAITWWAQGMSSHVAGALFLVPLGLLGLAASRRIAWHFACEESGRRVLESWSSPFGASVRELCSLDQVEAVWIERTGDHPTVMEATTLRVALQVRDLSARLFLTDTAVEPERLSDLEGRARRLAGMLEVPCLERRQPEVQGSRFWPSLGAALLVMPLATWPDPRSGLLLDLLMGTGAMLVHETSSFSHRTDRPGSHGGVLVAGFLVNTLLVIPLVLSLVDWFRLPVPAVVVYLSFLWGWFPLCRLWSDRMLARKERPLDLERREDRPSLPGK